MAADHNNEKLAFVASILPQFHNHWEEAVSELKTSIDPQEFSVVTSVSNIDTLLSQIRALEKRYRERKVARLCDPWFSELDRLTAVVKIFVQTNPAISGLIWGSTYFLLQVAVRHRDYLENVVKMFEVLHQHMPRLRTYAELFTNGRQIESAVRGMYKEILRFCLNAIRHLKINPLGAHGSLSCVSHEALLIGVAWWSQFVCFYIPRKSHQQQFNHCLSNIKDHAHWIDVEAFVAFHQASIDVARRRHEEIMSSLDRPMAMSSAATGQGVLSTPYARSPTSEKIQVISWPENPKLFGRDDELKLLSQALPSSSCSKLLIFSIIGMGQEALSIYVERTGSGKVDGVTGKESSVGMKEFDDLVLDEMNGVGDHTEYDTA